MKIEEYKLGQKVSLYGRIDAIDIANIHDKENTTILSIKTVTGKISVNPKWEEVTIELDQPKPVVQQTIFDVIESFDDDVDYLHEHMSRQSEGVREWLTHNERDFYEAWLAYPNITVEKEKLYTVEIPNPNSGMSYIFLTKRVSGVSIDMIDNVRWKADKRNQLTEQEIRKDFDWAFRWAKEVTE